MIPENVSSTVIMEPYIDLMEPIKDFTFRYMSDQKKHGCLPDIYVTLKNYHGEHNEKIKFKCIVFRKEHSNLSSHIIVDHNTGQDVRDLYGIPVGGSCTVIFKGIVIKIVKRTFIRSQIKQKLMDEFKCLTGRKLDHLTNQELKKMDFNKIQLMFSAFRKVGDKWESICPPMVSNEIVNRRTKNQSCYKCDSPGDPTTKEVISPTVSTTTCDLDVESREPSPTSPGIFFDENLLFDGTLTRGVIIQSNIQIVHDDTSTFGSFYNPEERRIFYDRRVVGDVPSKPSNNYNMNRDEIIKYFSDIIYSHPTELEFFDFLHDPEIWADAPGGEEFSLISELDSLLQERLMETDGASSSPSESSVVILNAILMVLWMHKICCYQHTRDRLLNKIKFVFANQYKNGRLNIGAIICYYPDTFKLFLNSVEKLGIGSDILSMQNDQGKTCLHLLSEHGTTKDINDFVPLLIRLGSNPNVTDKDGDTALHILIRDNGSKECVKIFLKSISMKNVAFNWEIANNEAMTPLQLAEASECPDGVIKLLRKAVDKSADSGNEASRAMKFIWGIEKLFGKCFPCAKTDESDS